MIHPSSVNSQLAVPEPQRGEGHPCHIVLYDEVTRGESQLYVRQCTAAGPHALLMVAAHLGVSQEEDDEEDEGNQPGAHAVINDLRISNAVSFKHCMVGCKPTELTVAYLDPVHVLCKHEKKQIAELCTEAANTWQLPSSKLQQLAAVSLTVTPAHLSLPLKLLRVHAQTCLTAAIHHCHC